MIEFCSSPEQLERADYRGIMARWREALQPGHLLVAPYSRISSDPEGLLDDISGFLGTSKVGGASKRHVVTRQNVTSGEAIPREAQTQLEAVLEEACSSCRQLLDEIGPARIY